MSKDHFSIGTGINYLSIWKKSMEPDLMQERKIVENGNWYN